MWTAMTDQTGPGKMPRLILVFAGHMSFGWFCCAAAHSSHDMAHLQYDCSLFRNTFQFSKIN